MNLGVLRGKVIKIAGFQASKFALHENFDLDGT